METISPNLIPMVDVVFLIMLFFMLGADMGHRELEEVRLPTADQVREDKPSSNPRDTRLTVNVYHMYETEVNCEDYREGRVCVDENHWKIGINGKDYTSETLKPLMQEQADLERLDPNNPRISERRVMIRADQSALYGFVQKVMNVCAEVGIYKIEIGAAQKMEVR